MAEIPMVKCFVTDPGLPGTGKADVIYIPLRDFVSWKREQEKNGRSTVLNEVVSIWLDREETAKYPLTFSRLRSDAVKEIFAECYCEIHSLSEARYVAAEDCDRVRAALPGQYRRQCMNPKASRFGSRFSLREKPGFWIHPNSLSLSRSNDVSE